jgi:FkbM family methyltransferase
MTLLVLANESLGWRLLTIKEYEKNEMDCLTGLIRDDDICVDVGANIGIYSILMARSASLGSVIGFEPVALNRDLLAVNARLNGIHNLEVRPYAVCDRVGLTEFTVSADGGYSSMKDTGRMAVEERITVPMITLDEIFATPRRAIDVMKIDVEGAELLVLRGAHRILSDPHLRPRAILAELNPTNQHTYGSSPDELVAFLKTFGYDAHSITVRGVLPGWPQRGASEDALFVHPAASSVEHRKR